jgi:GNAT superfamily N-acetyltransferase
MTIFRPSVSGDVPALRTLWKLAFGDSEEYLDNFFHNYYRPERMLVLEVDGVIRSMTGWFDTGFVIPGDGTYPAAYLYAVATHPEFRGQKLAARLLAEADGFFARRSIPAVTTVPAEPSLHNFFGANGFRECFVTSQQEIVPQPLPKPATPILTQASPKEYSALRERLLDDLPHIGYPEDALVYQAGCCRLSGGGLLMGSTPKGPVCLCAEGTGNGTVVLKEFLGCPEARAIAMTDLPRILTARRLVVRTVVEAGEPWRFAMLKWLDEEKKIRWDWTTTGYLGLAFD